MQILKKFKLFMIMIARNMANIIARFFIGILLIKFFIKYSIANISDGIPNLKDIILFPVVIIRFILYSIFGSSPEEEE